jgi:hypothetical protein
MKYSGDTSSSRVAQEIQEFYWSFTRMLCAYPRCWTGNRPAKDTGTTNRMTPAFLLFRIVLNNYSALPMITPHAQSGTAKTGRAENPEQLQYH